MTDISDAEIKEACRLAQAFDKAGNGVMKMSHALGIARALLAVVAQRDAFRALLVEAHGIVEQHAAGHSVWIDAADAALWPAASPETIRPFREALDRDAARGPTCNHCRGPLQNLGCDCLGEQRGYQRALDEVAAFISDGGGEAICTSRTFATVNASLFALSEAIRAGRAVPTKPAGGDRE